MISRLRATAPSAALLASPLAGLRYGALGFALAFLSLPLYVLLPSHYADVHAVPLAALGGVLLLTRLIDALLDPFIGQAVDRLFARSTRQAWRIAAVAATVLAVGFAGLFLLPAGRSAILLWLAAALLLTYLAVSVLSVVHQAWGARLGGDAGQRARVVAWREGFGLAGVLVASVMPSVFGLGSTSAVLAGALAVGIWLLAGAPQAPAQAAQPAQPALSSTQPSAQALAQPAHWALPWHTASFRRLLAVFLLNGIASAVPATLVLFFVRDRLQLPDAEALFLGTYFGCAMLSVPLWLRAVRALGLARAWLVGMLLAILAFSGVLALGAGDRAGFVAVCMASGLALGADLTTPAALLTGVLQRAGHGAWLAGVYVGWWNAATKLNLGLAAGLALPLLALAGYAPGQRDTQALQALTLAYVAVPCALKLAAVMLLWRWRNLDGDTL